MKSLITNQINNQRGAITIDYLFAFFLVSGFSMVIMTFSAALTMVEVTQYMTFAAARNYFSANTDEGAQKSAAYRKFEQLKAHPTVSPLLSGGWFSIPEDGLIVDYNISKYPAFEQYTPGPQEENLFHGAVAKLNIPLLNFRIPFFGSTVKSDASDEEKGFTTNITAFLGREPTFKECADFNEQRWVKIKQLANQSGGASYSNAQGDSDYVAINDNGC